MDPNEQQIAIAEACGWIPEKWGMDNTRTRWVRDGEYAYDYGDVRELPDYTRDLNAIHAAEMRLVSSPDSSKRARFRRELQRIVYDEKKRRPYYMAKASQRAEALLRTIGKWTAQPAASDGEQGEGQ